MDTRRLQLLLALSRLGSMRAVAEAQPDHLDRFAADRRAGTGNRRPLIEPEGRRVRLTPAGQRLADHAVTILAAIDSGPTGPRPRRGTGGHRTRRRFRHRRPRLAVSDRRRPRGRYPKVEFVISEFEPIEAFALLTDDDLDLALTYDYNLAPASSARRSRPCRCGRWMGTGRSGRRARRTAKIADYADPRGSSTPATPLTKTPCGPWRPWPGSHRRSPTNRQPRPRRGSHRRGLWRRIAAHRAGHPRREGTPALPMAIPS